MSRDSALRGTTITFALMALERGVQMLVGLYVASSIARGYTQSDFAAWQIAFSMWVVAATIAGITGERVVLPRLCAATGAAYDDEWKTAFFAKFVSASVVATGLVLWGPGEAHPGIVPVVLLFAVMLPLGEPIGLAVQQAYAAGDFRTPQIARVSALLARALAVVAVITMHGSLAMLALAWLVEQAVLGAVLCRGWLRSRPWSRGRVRPDVLKVLFLRGAALTVSATALAALSRLDRLALADQLPTALLAQNAAAMSLLEAAFGLAAILALVTGAQSLYRGDTVRFGAHLRYVLAGVAMGGLLALMLWLAAAPIAALVFGDRYPLTGTLLQNAAWLLPLVFAQSMVQIPLLPRTGLAFHVSRSLAAVGMGVLVAALVLRAGATPWICAGAYAGYAVALLFDVVELWRRRCEVYGASAAPANPLGSDGAPVAAPSPAVRMP